MTTHNRPNSKLSGLCIPREALVSTPLGPCDTRSFAATAAVTALYYPRALSTIPPQMRATPRIRVELRLSSNRSQDAVRIIT